MDVVPTTLSVTNETAIRGQAMLDLITQYITFADSFFGFHPLGSNPQIRFPVLFVEPKSQYADMDSTTAKFWIKITYAIYWYVRDEKADDCAKLSSFIAEALIKLFSNNALGDIGTANPPSNKFRNYANPGGGLYWLEAVIKSIDWSVNYLDPEVSPALRYERSGRMLVEIKDVILK